MSEYYTFKKLIQKYKVTNDCIARYNSLKGIKNIDTLEADNMISTFYHSSNIEYEDELTIENTRIVVKDLVCRGVKRNKNVDRSTLLVEGMFSAYNFLNSIKDIKQLDIDTIMQFHRYLMLNLIGEDAGNLRTTECTIVGKEDVVKFTRPDKIENEMKQLSCMITNTNFSGYKTNYEKLKTIMDIKARFINIHPFSDGNGRTSRAILQKLCDLANIPIPVFAGWKRKDYHNGMYFEYVNDRNMSIIIKMYLDEIMNNEFYTRQMEESTNTKSTNELVWNKVSNG